MHRPVLPALRRPLSVAAVAATALAPLATLAAPADAAVAPGSVVISEVYGGGGSTSGAYKHDYVELYNPTSAPIDLGGTSVQYRSSGGTANPTGVTPLTGTIPAKGYYLVQEATSPTATGADLPTPQASGTIGLAAGAGTVFLANQTTALTAPPTGSLTGSAASSAGIVDLVGYGSSNTFEKAPTAAPSATTSVARDAAGKDTDDNSTDLEVAAGTPGQGPAATPPPPAEPVARTIAQIQGTGDTSPLVGQNVVTEGVVTAAYPTGGFNGFYVQTAGSGGDTDPTAREASDGVFVFGSAVAAAVEPGDHVQVTGVVSEFNGLTEVTPSSASGVQLLTTPAAAPVPAAVTLPAVADRESFEGMLLAPQGPFTVADNYTVNNFAEIGLAAGTTPLYAPTEVADAQDAAAIQQVKDENAARKVVLDDGSSTNYLTTGKDTPLPWLTQQPDIRVGAPATFAEPVVLDWRNSAWKLQPTHQLTAADALPVTFGHTRTTAPAATGGSVHIASFNVLNYFPTTGADVVAAGGSCSFYDDRAKNHVTVNSCTQANGEQGPRGAADAEDLQRQQDKIVLALNSLGADVVSLEEIENSTQFGQDRDAAVGRLVEALNTEAGSTVWAFVPSPASAADQSDEDVIRTAFIYKVAAVKPVGESVIDDVPVFDVARDPLAQGFETVGGGSLSRFAVIVNHFKSKGSGPDDGTGQGNSNPQRVAQAQEVVAFADRVTQTFGTEKVFLSGDFNAYTQEDPMQVLYAAGYTDIGSHESPEEHTYLFDGTVGSLDHVLANGPALQRVTGAHVWNINSVESVAHEYSRFNYNATSFYERSPYRASDHDPLVVGLDLPTAPVTTTTTASVTPVPVQFKQDQPVVRVEVGSAYGVIDGGTVELREHGVLVGTGTVSDGVATLTLPTTNKKGTHTLAVRYLGTPEADPSSTTTSYTVTKS